MKRISVSRPLGLGLAVAALLIAVAWALTQRGLAFRGDTREAREPAASAPASPGIVGRTGVDPVPRFAASSERFELVGALDGRRLTLWLDRFSDNAPLTGATLELEIGDLKFVAKAVDDRYEFELPAPLPAGVSPVTVTVTTADEVDLLAADLVVPTRGEGAR